MNLKSIRSAAFLALGLCLGNAAWSKTSVQAIQVVPNPMMTGQPFAITATISADVTQAVATVDFHPGETQPLDIPLTKQGAVWVGSGLVPDDLVLKPEKDEAKLKLSLLDNDGHKSEQVIHFDVNAPSLSAVFANGILTIIGDDLDNTITAARDTAGTILVFINGNQTPVVGGLPTVTNTSLIRILGLNGNDVLLVDDSSGPMPPANLFGGDGDDTLTGSRNADVLDGGPGNDTLNGGDGNDRLVGGPGNDILIGGRGDDQLIGGEGDDQMVWNPGDGNDLVEGEGGVDTLLFNGANIAEIVDLSANGQRLRFTRNVANIVMDCDGVERVVFRALGGADQVNVNDLTGTAVTQVVVDLSTSAGGDNSVDTITVVGTENSDRITVNQSDTQADILGLSAAVTVLGLEQNFDRLFINGRGANDSVTLLGSKTNEVADLSVSTNGHSMRFFSDVSQIEINCDAIEQVNVIALGGTNQVTVNDLTGTAVTHVGIDLSGETLGAGDGHADTVIINGSQTNDTITVTGSAAGMDIVGLTAAVAIIGADHDLDQLTINGLAGTDTIDASAVQLGAMNLTLNGGDGPDTLIGGAGNDLINGGRGDDLLIGGAGDDIFPWNPGDGSDIIEGQSGQDTLLFNGANIAEEVELSANGQRLRFTRNIASIVMDCNGIESVLFNALGGADKITVNNLSGTDVTHVNLNLAATGGSPDNAADTVIIEATTNADVVTVTGTPATGVSVLGLSAIVNIVGTDPTLDRLVIDLLDGDDVLNAADLLDGVIGLIVNGGPGDDLVVGSAGADMLFGDEGDDILEGGPGTDALDGGPGNNVLIQ